jgi:hypothetical protein
LSGSTHCIIGAISRFELVQQFFWQTTIFTSCICTFYEIAATATCVNLCSFSIVRMLCLTNATFMEEHVGERKIRHIIAVTIVLASSSVCLSIILSGEILTGSIFSLSTNQVTLGGDAYPLTFIFS